MHVVGRQAEDHLAQDIPRADLRHDRGEVQNEIDAGKNQQAPRQHRTEDGKAVEEELRKNGRGKDVQHRSHA